MLKSGFLCIFPGQSSQSFLHVWVDIIYQFGEILHFYEYTFNIYTSVFMQ